MQFELCPTCGREGVYTSKWSPGKNCRYANCNYSTSATQTLFPSKPKTPKKRTQPVKKAKKKKTKKKVSSVPINPINPIKKPLPEPHVVYGQLRRGSSKPRLSRHHWVTSRGRKSRSQLINPCDHKHKDEDEAYICAQKLGNSHLSMVNDETGLHVMDIPAGFLG